MQRIKSTLDLRIMATLCSASVLIGAYRNVTVQANVSYVSSASLWFRPDVRLHAYDGLCSVRRQAIPIQFPLFQLGRRWKGRSTHARPHPCSSGLSSKRRAVDEADRVVRQAQADQQPAGRQRTCTFQFIHTLHSLARFSAGYTSRIRCRLRFGAQTAYTESDRLEQLKRFTAGRFVLAETVSKLVETVLFQFHFNYALSLTKIETSTTSGGSRNFEKREAQDNVSASSSFTANVNSELYAIYTGNGNLLREKIYEPIGDGSPHRSPALESATVDDLQNGELFHQLRQTAAQAHGTHKGADQ